MARTGCTAPTPRLEQELCSCAATQEWAAWIKAALSPAMICASLSVTQLLQIQATRPCAEICATKPQGASLAPSEGRCLGAARGKNKRAAFRRQLPPHSTVAAVQSTQTRAGMGPDAERAPRVAGTHDPDPPLATAADRAPCHPWSRFLWKPPRVLEVLLCLCAALRAASAARIGSAEGSQRGANRPRDRVRGAGGGRDYLKRSAGAHFPKGKPAAWRYGTREAK